MPNIPVGSTTSSSLPASCQEVITPTCILDLYGAPRVPATQRSNNLYVSGFSGQFANREDLKAFLEANRPDERSATFRVISVANGTNDQDPADAGVEADLDIQYTVGIATGVPVTFVTTGPTDIETDDDFFTALLNGANFLLTQKTVPTVLTTSYGLNENLVSRSLAK